MKLLIVAHCLKGLLECQALFSVANEITAHHRRGKQATQIFAAGCNRDVEMFGRQSTQQADDIALHHLHHIRGGGLGKLGDRFRAQGLNILPQQPDLIAIIQKLRNLVRCIVHVDYLTERAESICSLTLL